MYVWKTEEEATHSSLNSREWFHKGSNIYIGLWGIHKSLAGSEEHSTEKNSMKEYSELRGGCEVKTHRVG